MRQITLPMFGQSEGYALPQGDFRFVALDVETASALPGSVCQIGLACVRPDNSIEGFSMLVNPATAFASFNIRLHGIGPEHVADAPGFAEALLILLPLIGRNILVQHSDFDRRAMLAGCDMVGLPPPPLRWSNSVTIARRAWPELTGNGGHGLGNLKRVLGLEFKHHDAAEDARAAAQVVLQAETRMGMDFRQILQGRAPLAGSARTMPPI